MGTKRANKHPWTTASAILACGHEVWVFDTSLPIRKIGDHQLKRLMRLRGDGWYAARKCPDCRRKRRVLSLRIEVDSDRITTADRKKALAA